MKAGKVYRHATGFAYRALSVDGDCAVLEAMNPDAYGEPKEPFTVPCSKWAEYVEVENEQ